MSNTEIIIVILLILAALFGWAFWRQYKKRQRGPGGKRPPWKPNIWLSDRVNELLRPKPKK